MPKKPQKTRQQLESRIAYLENTIAHYEVNLTICHAYWGNMPPGLLAMMDEYFARPSLKPTTREELLSGVHAAVEAYREKELKSLLEEPNDQDSGIQEAPAQIESFSSDGDGNWNDFDSGEFDIDI